MTELKWYIGTQLVQTLQIVNNDSSIPVSGQYLPTDVLTAYIFGGQTQTPLFTLTGAACAWSDVNTGKFRITGSAAQGQLLELNGEYQLAVWLVRGTSDPTPVWRGLIRVVPSPGTSSQQIMPYCKLSDMLKWGPWIGVIQGTDYDTEGFYDQRLEARYWMDWTILNCYRGAYVGLFEYHSVTAFAFGYAGWRRSLGPSPSLITYLRDNFLILRPQIIECCSYYALGVLGCSQIGINDAIFARGEWFRDMAQRKLIETTAEVDLNGDGIGELFINLGSTNTLYT
jgi:hypothetical protein